MAGALQVMVMKIISFAWTTPALLAGRKTCTRRNWNNNYARSFKLGEQEQAYDKSPRIGGQQVGIVRLVVEPIYTMDMPEEDYEAEGLAWMEEQGLMVPVTDIHSQKKLPYHPRRFWEDWKANITEPLWVVRFELVYKVDDYTIKVGEEVTGANILRVEDERLR